MPIPFELIAFTTDPERARAVLDGGAYAVLVDWENQGKYERQQGADTEINHDTPVDLVRIRNAVSGTVICRINGFHDRSREEVESAIRLGADEILLPMVRSVEEVERTLEWVAGRCHTGILIETSAAVALAPELGRLPLRRVYAGLNDLAIDRGSPSIFSAVADGTLDRMQPNLNVPFGFGGLTLPECGHPIPSKLLLGELIRLDASFSFLRRSFWRDVAGKDPSQEIPRILTAVQHTQRWSAWQRQRSREAFLQAVDSVHASLL